MLAKLKPLQRAAMQVAAAAAATAMVQKDMLSDMRHHTR